VSDAERTLEDLRRRVAAIWNDTDAPSPYRNRRVCEIVREVLAIDTTPHTTQTTEV
jgi:hypothetical protein